MRIGTSNYLFLQNQSSYLTDADFETKNVCLLNYIIEATFLGQLTYVSFWLESRQVVAMTQISADF